MIEIHNSFRGHLKMWWIGLSKKNMFIYFQYCCQASAYGEVSPCTLGETSAWMEEGSWLLSRNNSPTGQMSVGKQGIIKARVELNVSRCADSWEQGREERKVHWTPAWHRAGGFPTPEARVTQCPLESARCGN